MTTLDLTDSNNDLLDYIFPFHAEIKYARDKNSSYEDIKKSFTKLKQYTSEDAPHDKDLHKAQIDELYGLLYNNFPIEKYPELWL